MVVLSRYTVEPLFEARRSGAQESETSLDLGRTKCRVALEAEGIVLPDGGRLSWEAIDEVTDCETACFLVKDGRVERIQFYSEEFRRFYSLLPTRRAPTMAAAGFPMHRIKGIDPHEDTLRKIRTIAPVTGTVLDTATGLGYTAIEAVRTANRVVTIEIDPVVLEICRRNPWSRELFENPHIEQRIGDSFEVIREFADGVFNRIFHDPPTMKLAGQLYSGEFYAELRRVLSPKGRLFHYIGDLESALGSTVGKGAVRRLADAGFTVQRRPEAFGLVAVKR